MTSKIEISKLHDAVICNEEDSVLEISRIMRDTRKRHILVIDAHLKLLGVISAFDINNRVVAEEREPKKIMAKDIMTKPIETIDINSTYEQACEKMVERELHTIPVTKDGKLVGILDLSLIFRNHTGDGKWASEIFLRKCLLQGKV